MSTSPLPDDVRRYVQFAIPSVPYLEALLLMRAAPQQSWDAAGIARRLYLGERNAAELLAQLAEAQIIAPREDGHAYSPRDADLAALLDSLAAAYSQHLVEISLLIHSKADGKQQHFVNAFLFRRKR
ncbi:MAG: hypothetical protein V7631_2987 [Massilia sp.]|jgi:hypothetical protein